MVTEGGYGGVMVTEGRYGGVMVMGGGWRGGWGDARTTGRVTAAGTAVYVCRGTQITHMYKKMQKTIKGGG